VADASLNSLPISPVSMNRRKSFGCINQRVRWTVSGSFSRSHIQLARVKPVASGLPVQAASWFSPICACKRFTCAALRWSAHKIAGRKAATCSSRHTRLCICPANPIACTSRARTSAWFSA
jgi:hypothetical protein